MLACQDRQVNLLLLLKNTLRVNSCCLLTTTGNHDNECCFSSFVSNRRRLLNQNNHDEWTMYYSSSPSYKQDLLTKTTASNNGSHPLLANNSSRHQTNAVSANIRLGPDDDAQTLAVEQKQAESITGMLNNFSKALGKLLPFYIHLHKYVQRRSDTQLWCAGNTIYWQTIHYHKQNTTCVYSVTVAPKERLAGR